MSAGRSSPRWNGSVVCSMPIIGLLGLLGLELKVAVSDSMRVFTATVLPLLDGYNKAFKFILNTYLWIRIVVALAQLPVIELLLELLQLLFEGHPFLLGVDHVGGLLQPTFRHYRILLFIIL